MDCDVQTIAAITRAVTYIIAALGGALSIYLGYRLYVRGVESAVSGSASHAGWSGTLRSTGPGVFLVLFGAAILATIVFSKADFLTEESIESSAGTAPPLIPAAYATTQPTPGASRPQDSGRARQAARNAPQDCIVARRVTRRNTSFVDGGPLSQARLRAAMRTSLLLVEREQASETQLDRLRSLAHARETLEALSEELAED